MEKIVEGQGMVAVVPEGRLKIVVGEECRIRGVEWGGVAVDLDFGDAMPLRRVVGEDELVVVSKTEVGFENAVT